jgi:hypothetical protein
MNTYNNESIRWFSQFGECLASLQKIVSASPWISTSKNILKGNENVFLYKKCASEFVSELLKTIKVQMTQISLKYLMNKQNVMKTYNRILFCNKN